MRLEDIGFYTLSDERARTCSADSPVARAEMLITGRCNFKCPYCRGARPELKGDLSLARGRRHLQILAERGLKNVRFSGGEPTLNPNLPHFVREARRLGAERVAISTNGSADFGEYLRLLGAGVDDFSISLDACCASTGDAMAGKIPGSWEKVVSNIGKLAHITYVTVGIVLTADNLVQVLATIALAESLHVRDIRVIPAAQDSKHLQKILMGVPKATLERYPILRYRIGNMEADRSVRGLAPQDSGRCRLVLDDVAMVGDYHFPCIIYMREGGQPIGRIGPNIRAEREAWSHRNCHNDPICKGQCLDVCRDYNLRAMEAAK